MSISRCTLASSCSAPAQRRSPGERAHELYATLLEIGVPPDAGAGSVSETVSRLDCKIDPNAVIANAGGGAHCDYAAPQ